MTIIEKLRTASDEKVAKQIIWMTENSMPFCQWREECVEGFQEDREIPAERCAECMLDYLRKPCEGGADG